MSDLRLEVERKYRADDLAAVRKKLAVCGATYWRTEPQVDEYFIHPCRDLRGSDEAIRIRRSDGAPCLTYKGPRRERQTKVREEIECPLSAASDEALAAILHHLGFRTLRTVTKSRELYRLATESFAVQLGLDTLPELGDFVEIEIVTAPQELDAAKAVIESLAEQLELHDLVEQSYLGLLLAADATRSASP